MKYNNAVWRSAKDPKVFDKNSTSGQDKKDITGPDTELIYV